MYSLRRNNKNERLTIKHFLKTTTVIQKQIYNKTNKLKKYLLKNYL